MKTRQGGTNKWCPYCEKVVICEVKSASEMGYERGQNRFRRDEPDIRWFERHLLCKTCHNYWTSAEVDERLLTELVVRRKEMRELTAKVRQSAKEIARLSRSMQKLANSVDAAISR